MQHDVVMELLEGARVPKPLESLGNSIRFLRYLHSTYLNTHSFISPFQISFTNLPNTSVDNKLPW